MKKVFWITVFGGMAGLIAWFSVSNIQPRAIPKIKLSAFETPRVAANSVWLRLQEELKSQSLWLWGLDPGDDFQIKVLQAFLAEPPGNAPGFDEIWLDRELGFDLPQKTRMVFFKSNDAQISSDMARAVEQNKRVLLVTATPYAASFLKEGPAWKLLQKQLPFYSLLFSDFPRRRSEEAKMAFPCILSHADERGVGELGCQIQQRARLLYRKTQTAGARVGVMDQISGHDFLFLVAIEP